MSHIHIAVAEDNSADLFRLQTVLSELRIDFDLTIAVNGEEARDFILKQGRFSNSPRADLILLDVQMPKLTGLEVLREIPYSGELPVCMLTSSEREKELIKKHFAPKQISYLMKPVDGEHLVECLRCYDHLRPVAEEAQRHLH